MALLERLGQQYERDHEKDLREQLTYLPPEAHGVGWQAPGAAGYVYGQAEEGQDTVHGELTRGGGRWANARCRGQAAPGAGSRAGDRDGSQHSPRPRRPI